jgi:SAM-dependent methyltransferase
MIETIKQVVPNPIRSLILDVPYIFRDIVDTLAGRRDPLIPPTRLMFDGARDLKIFKDNGAEFLKYYIDLCALKPDDRVLDVGCGIGRKTIPLTTYLNKRGSYEGIDINLTGVAWCQKKITPRFPNFRFQRADVYNKRYNPQGQYSAATYRFPYEDEAFDFVVLGSVFTHMLPPEVENYLSEVARVLKTGHGRCLISYFLLNETSLALRQEKASYWDFKHDMGLYRVVNAEAPEHAVAHDQAYILALYEKNGLRVRQPIQYGSWPGREIYLSYQDLVIATKEG